MESMDISYGEGALSNETAMIPHQDMMDVSAAQEDDKLKELSMKSNNTIGLGSHKSPESSSCSDEYESFKLADSLPNNSFPANQELSVVDAGLSSRFPLQTVIDSNQINLLSESNKSFEKKLLHSPNTSTLQVEINHTGKENVFHSPNENPLMKFPVQSKQRDDVFLAATSEIAPTNYTVPSSATQEEKFTPSSEFIFSADDFDCLLSRGCSQTVNGLETSHSESTSVPKGTDQPRNSILLNFDPLLRRQTLLKTEKCIEEGVATTSACLAWDALEQQPEIAESDKEVPLLDTPTNNVRQSTSALIALEEDCSFTDKDTENQEQSSCNISSKTTSDSDQSNKTNEQISLLSITPTRNDRDETISSSKSIDPFLSSASSFEQDLSNREIENHTTNLGAEQSSAAVDIQSNNFDADEQQQQSTIIATSVKSVLDTNSIEYLERITSANNDLMYPNANMLAETQPSKQGSTSQKMSDDRMAQNGEGHVEMERNSKIEEINIADMEKKMHDVELREESMLKRITEKDKTISKMSNVVEAYERTIAELISEKEALIRNHELECENLKQDNEINAQHLESLEKTFSNLYAKYERMKKNAVKYKEHEENLLEKVMKLEECLRAQEQRYEQMKGHAMSQLENANTKIDEAIRNHSQESAKLKAQIKKEELYRISINEQLIQKSKENEELVKICDELISDTN